jgi:hypothetical protein
VARRESRLSSLAQSQSVGVAVHPRKDRTATHVRLPSLAVHITALDRLAAGRFTTSLPPRNQSQAPPIRRVSLARAARGASNQNQCVCRVRPAATVTPPVAVEHPVSPPQPQRLSVATTVDRGRRLSYLCRVRTDFPLRIAYRLKCTDFPPRHYPSTPALSC